MILTRRQIARLAVSAAVAATLSVTCPEISQAKLARGAATGAGTFPNSAPAFLPMRQVYPAPTGVQSFEPHQFAYFDAANNTAHGFMWQKRVGVSFGRWPHRYVLVSGPPGMAFGATTWNTAWDGQGDAAYKAGYGVLRWTPTAAISPASPTTVSVDVIDQDSKVLNLTWTIYTAGDITQTGGLYAFMNADTGSDSTGTGAFGAPWQTASHALGTSATSPGAAPAQCVLVPMGATATYIFPQTSTNVFTWNNAHKPASIVGIPGQTATFDMSSGAGTSGTTGVGIQPASSGLFMQDITLENYTAIADYRAFTWSFLSRLSWQGVIWNNAGYGTDSSNNASMFYPQGGGTPTGKYVFITGCEENGRQSNSQANNCAFFIGYSNQELLIEHNLANSPSSAVGECFYMKSDIGFGCLRSNAGFFSSCGHGFDWGQAPYQGSNSSESCYNVGVNVSQNWNPSLNTYSWGSLAFYRNNMVSGGNGLACLSPNNNVTAPYTNSNTQPPNISSLIPPISTSSSGGHLADGTWFYVVTTLGVTGESTISNSNGNSRMSITSSGGGTSVNTVPWLLVPNDNGYRVYRGTVSGSENQYIQVAAGTDSLTDDGTLSWTSATPPASQTAVTSARFTFNSNVMQNPTQTAPPRDNTTQDDGLNQFSATLGALLDTTTGLLLVSNGGRYGVQLV